VAIKPSPQRARR